MQIEVGKVLLVADATGVLALCVANTELYIDTQDGSEDIQFVYRNSEARNPSSICFGFTISDAQYYEPDYVNHSRRLTVEDQGDMITCRIEDYRARRLTKICTEQNVIKGAVKSDSGLTTFRLHLDHNHVIVGIEQKFRAVHRTKRILTALKNRAKY